VKDFGFRRIWFRRIWALPILLFLGLFINSLAWGATPTDSLHPSSIEQREHQISNLKRASQFAEVPHLAWDWSCEQIQSPIALATPDPLAIPAARNKRVRVSFIIGTDGRVHSPLILESAGYAGDRHVLDTVRHWRYRPATCNGVPTETEGKIEFSIR
jgi:TonB family protein